MHDSSSGRGEARPDGGRPSTTTVAGERAAPASNERGRDGGNPERDRARGRRGSLRDAVSKPVAQRQLKKIVGTYAVAGLGVGASILLLTASPDGGTVARRGGLGLGLLTSALVFGPVVGCLQGQRTADALADSVGEVTVFSTAGIGAGVGHVAMVTLASLATAASTTGGGEFVGTLLLPLAISGVGSAVAGAGGVWTALRVGELSRYA